MFNFLSLFKFFVVLCVLCVLSFSGCSILAYTPVVAMAVVGMDRTSLDEEEQYKKWINYEHLLEDTAVKSWQLHKFNPGRYYLVFAGANGGARATFICSLGGKPIKIKHLFRDEISGGVFFDGETSCDGNDLVEIPKVHLPESLQKRINSLELKSF
jgi:hypothetical protein